MTKDIMKKLENTFLNYTEQYDHNIKKLVKEKEVELSIEELEEILADAKNVTLNKV